MADYHPFPDRKEHDYVNEMTVLIAKGRLVIKEATQIMDRIQAVVSEYAKISKEIRGE